MLAALTLTSCFVGSPRALPGRVGLLRMSDAEDAAASNTPSAGDRTHTEVEYLKNFFSDSAKKDDKRARIYTGLSKSSTGVDLRFKKAASAAEDASPPIALPSDLTAASLAAAVFQLTGSREKSAALLSASLALLQDADGSSPSAGDRTHTEVEYLKNFFGGSAESQAATGPKAYTGL
jgi:hypothetical protein